MNPPVAFLDASVLYPAGLRNLLLRLASNHCFHARWSADVHREWMAAVLRDYPDVRPEALERTRSLMDRHAEGCIVTGYARLVPGIHLPDRADRHVVAAAIVGEARAIVTRNLRHFPAARIRAYGLRAVAPDDFVMALFDMDGGAVVASAREHRASLRRPPLSVDDYLEVLRRQGLPRIVDALRGLRSRL